MYAPSPGDVKDIFRSLVTLVLCRYWGVSCVRESQNVPGGRGSPRLHGYMHALFAICWSTVSHAEWQGSRRIVRMFGCIVPPMDPMANYC